MKAPIAVVGPGEIRGSVMMAAMAMENGGLMGFNGDLMGFNGIYWKFNHQTYGFV